MLGSFLLGGVAAAILMSALILTGGSRRQTPLALALIALLWWLADLPETLNLAQALSPGGWVVHIPEVPPAAELAAAVPPAGPLVAAAWVLSLHDAVQQRSWPWVGAFVSLSMLSVAAYLEAKNAAEIAATTVAGLLVLYQGAMLGLIVAMLAYAVLAFKAARAADVPVIADES